jgi:hypothetical protein
MPKPGRQGLAAAALESVNEVAAAEFAAKPFLKAADAQIIPLAAYSFRLLSRRLVAARLRMR